MREVKLGEQTVPIVASVMGVYYHSREFSADGHEADVLVDTARLVEMTGGGEKPSAIVLLRLLWTMARSAQHGKPFPDFATWMESIDVGLVDKKLWADVLEEATAGFFRT